MKPWREIAIPHPDVLEGTFQQSEFAADMAAVQKGTASKGYQDAVEFYKRTYITEGMRLLLISVAQRLNGLGGEPVIQLQTAFGGGKTHTLLAVYHLAGRTCPLNDLSGIPLILDQVKLMDVPRSKIAVIDGHSYSPGQSWMHGNQAINTLWGELAWQLGGEDAFQLLKASDEKGTSPGKDILQKLLESCAPCVILMDELVSYIRNFSEGIVYSGGTFESNISFIQALTEAVKVVPNAILLASLPESETEIGGGQGVVTERALKKVFGRIQALWKPIVAEEAFEIVRRRLFEPIRDTQLRNEVCRAYAATYQTESGKLPSETLESRYLDRLMQAYPIHPEVFDRLYEDWSTIDSFQRTRGVLKLLAKIIHRLWKDQNQDLMIMPGSFPLYDGNARHDLLYYLEGGWDAVIEQDIDGEHSETQALEIREARFGAVNAARRVARSLFLGSAPSAGGIQKGARGLDRGRIILGCLQPGQTSSVFSDALNRLTDRLHYLNLSGDKNQDSTRFWFDTRANLRREMEDRKGQFDENEVRKSIQVELQKLLASDNCFAARHIFTPHADVPDDSTLRLIILPPERFYSKQESRPVYDEVLQYIKNNGNRPRYKGNRLLFLAAAADSISRMKDNIRTFLAWQSVMASIKGGRLNVDRLQEQQAQGEANTASEVLPKAVRDCYKWILCPIYLKPTDQTATIEAFPLNTSGSVFTTEIERVCNENEMIIKAWSPVHLANRLKEFYWKENHPAVRALDFWEDTQKYLYLPRMKDRDVFERAVIAGSKTRDYFATADAITAEGKFTGFSFGDALLQVDNTTLLISPDAALAYEVRLREETDAANAIMQELAQREKDEATNQENQAKSSGDNAIAPEQGAHSGPAAGGGIVFPTGGKGPERASSSESVSPRVVRLMKSFHGSVEVTAQSARFKLSEIADEVIKHLADDPNATVTVMLEIHADFPNGASEQIKRTVSENANQLKFSTKEWE